MFRSLVLVVTIAGLSMAGCTSRDHYRYIPGDAAHPTTHDPAGGGVFEYARQPIANHGEIEDETDTYVVRSLILSWPNTDGRGDRRLRARFSQSKTPGRKPLVVILPIWGLHVFPSDALTEHIRDRSMGGINVLQVQGDTTLFNWTTLGAAQTEAEFFTSLDQMVANFTAAVIDVRRVMDWAEARNDVDPDRIALGGFSIGAVIASIAVAAEPRVDAGFIVMGGGNLHETLASCDLRVGDMSKHVTQRFGWTMAEFKMKVAARLAPIEPVRYGHRVDPGRMLLIEADEDGCLSQAGRDAMWDAMGRPERIAYHYDHKTSFLAMTFLGAGDLQDHTYRFLRRVFARPVEK